MTKHIFNNLYFSLKGLFILFKGRENLYCKCRFNLEMKYFDMFNFPIILRFLRQYGQILFCNFLKQLTHKEWEQNKLKLL